MYGRRNNVKREIGYQREIKIIFVLYFLERKYSRLYNDDGAFLNLQVLILYTSTPIIVFIPLLIF